MIIDLIQWMFCLQTSSNSYQTIIVTDRNTTYAVYSYPCLSDPPRQSAVIGISSPIGTIQYRYSNLDTTSFLGCSHGNSTNMYSLVYSLTEIQNISSFSNGMFHLCTVTHSHIYNPLSCYTLISSHSLSLTGSCVAAGLAQQSCCRPFADPTESCRAGSGDGACYCDGLCFERNDCCSDIHSVQDLQSCVPSQFTVVPIV